MGEHWRRRHPFTDWPLVETDPKQWKEWADAGDRGGYPPWRTGLIVAAMVWLTFALAWLVVLR